MSDCWSVITILAVVKLQITKVYYCIKLTTSRGARPIGRLPRCDLQRLAQRGCLQRHRPPNSEFDAEMHRRRRGNHFTCGSLPSVDGCLVSDLIQTSPVNERIFLIKRHLTVTLHRSTRLSTVPGLVAGADPRDHRENLVLRGLLHRRRLGDCDGACRADLVCCLNASARGGSRQF